MNQLHPSALRLLALFPHENTARSLRSYRRRLLAVGYIGSRSFPLCAPLAVLRRPLTREELASIARGVRTAATLTGERGRIVAKAPARITADGLPSYLGLPLSISALQDVPTDAILSACSVPALVLAVLADISPTGDTSATGASLPPPPDPDGPTVFRAAYLANLVVFPADRGDPSYSFEWEIGEPRWLPGKAR